MKLNADLLAKAAGFERLDDRLLVRLEQYASALSEANQKINLISRSANLQLEIEQQIAISLLPLKLVQPGIRTWMDVGSGGGFPVIPLACALESIQFTAVEQIAKKAYFVERTSQELGLRNVEVVASSIQNVIASNPDTRWGVMSIKAVTSIPASLKWAGKLLTENGIMLTYKPQEVDGAVEEMYGFEFITSLDVKELIDTIDLRVVMYKKS